MNSVFSVSLWSNYLEPISTSDFGFTRVVASNLRQNMRLGFFKHRDHLFPFHRGKPLQEILDGFPSFQMIEQAPHRHPRPGKHRLASEDIRITGYSLFIAMCLPPRILRINVISSITAFLLCSPRATRYFYPK